MDWVGRVEQQAQSLGCACRQGGGPSSGAPQAISCTYQSSTGAYNLQLLDELENDRALESV